MNDIFCIGSFGIILNEILSRQVPFFEIERSRDAATHAMAGGRPTVAFEDAILEDIVSRCWAQDAQSRPSVAVVHQRLQFVMLERFSK